MSTSYRPLFKDATGRLQLFGDEETLSWDFTSATGNPMELLVGGSTYFTFDRNGALALESNVAWNTDSGGDVGGQYDYRPDYVNAATAVRVGAVAGGTDYGSMLTLNRLTLGHADVDKYIDANQASGGTPPFLRYNAVNTRWEYSNNGVTVIAFDAGFGVGTWDAIYATDKTLTIDGASLVWSQTATTNVGFAVTRNLINTSTDTGVLLVEQQHASDDQPPLVLAQNAATSSALSIYEGLYGVDGLGGGTERFSFNAAGQLAITTNATLAAAAVSINQTDDNEAFLLVTGTSAVDASKNVSTANSGTADMIRVEVDGGGGAATRWVPAYNSVTLPGTVSWDGIYLLNKTLDINSSVLTFDQSSTGVGFTVSRNVGATTTAPLMTIEQQHAADTYPPLGIYQNNSAVDVLQLYDGSFVGGTMRFQFQPLGRLNIVGSASLTTEALRLELNDATTPFAEFKGTAAAGAGNNISTDSAPVADMIQVEVDAGSGINTRWIPAYNSTGLASAYTWDLIYAADKYLDIDDTTLQFEQTKVNGGHAFELYRDLAAASTTAAVVHIENKSSTDDQPALLLEGGIGAVAAGMDVLQIQTTSAGMTGGTEVLRSSKAILTTHATDAAGAELHGYYVDSPTPVGSGETHGFHATANLDYGLYVLSPSYFTAPTNTTVAAVTSTNATATTDVVTIAATSGGMSSVALTALDISITGNVGDSSATYTGIDLTFTDGGGGSTETAVGVNFSNTWDLAFVANASAQFADNSAIIIGNSADAKLEWDTGQTQDALLLGLGASNSVIVCETADMGTDFGHAAKTNPTVFVQSADATTPAQWISFQHNQTDGVIETGAGKIQLLPVAGSVTQIGDAFAGPTYVGANDDLFVSGQLEVASTLRAAGTVVYYSAARAEDNVPIYWGTGSDVRTQYSTAQAAHALVFGLSDSASPDGSRNLIFCDTSDIAKNFDHAASSDPTLFVHSNLDPDTDNGEYIQLSYTGLLAGTMESDRATYDFTIKGSNALLGATVNMAGGNLILEGGEKATIGTVDGIVQVGSTAPSHATMVTKDCLMVGGELEVDGNVNFDAGVTCYGALTTYGILYYGGGGANFSKLNASAGADHLLLALGSEHGRQFVIGDAAYFTSDYEHAAQTNPTLFVHSALDPGTDYGEYVGLSYTGLLAGTMSSDRATYDFTIKGANAYVTGDPTNHDGADLVLEGGDKSPAGTGVDGIVQIGAAFSSGRGLVDKDDLGIGGKLEVDGTAYFDAGFVTYANSSVPSNVRMYFGSSNESSIVYHALQTPDALMIGAPDAGDTSRNVILCEQGDVSTDFAHAQQTNPTLWIQSADASSPAQYLNFAHNQTDGVISSGAGKIKLTPATGAEIVSAVNSTALALTPGNPTTNTDFMTITGTSGGLSAETLNALSIDLTENAADVTATIQGIYLDFTTAASTTPVNTAIKIDEGWQHGIHMDSDPAANGSTLIACNVGTADSFLAVFAEGTIGAIGAANFRWMLRSDGRQEGTADNAGTGIIFTQNYSSGGSTLLTLRDGNASAARFDVLQEGNTDADVDHATIGWRIGQSGAGPILELRDGTASAGNNRLSVATSGQTIVTTSATIASNAMEINQQDADEEFIYFNGTPSNPAAGSVPADNITEINGSGDVVGPQTTSGSPDTGWAFKGMVKMRSDQVAGGSIDVWVATYTVVTS